MKTRHRAMDWVFLLALTVMWGTAFMWTKIAVDGLPPTVVVAGRLALGCVLLLGTFSTAIATVVYFRLINTAGPAFVSQINYLITLWAVAMGVLFLGETIQRTHLYALALVLGGIFITQLERRRAAPSQGQTGEVTT